MSATRASVESNRVAGHEDEAQLIVTDVVIRRCALERPVLGQRLPVLDLQLAPQLLALALQERRGGAAVDASPPRDGHQPGARVLRDA